MPTPSPAAAFLSDEVWESLRFSIDEDKCIPILGPEVSRGTLAARAKGALEFAAQLRGYPLDRSDELYQVAQFLAVTKTTKMEWRTPLARRLRELMAASPTAKSIGPYDMLAKLPFSIYVTTNIDTSMTRALQKARKKVQDALCPWFSDDYALKQTVLRTGEDPEPGTPVVFYLFGNLDAPESLVLSEDDHLDFLVRMASPARMSNNQDVSVLPNKLVAKLKESYLLFLGYRLEDFDFRILLHSLGAILRQNQESMAYPLIAVQFESTQPPSAAAARIEDLRIYLQKNCKRFKIEVLWGSCEEFVAELGRRYEQSAAGQPAQGITP